MPHLNSHMLDIVGLVLLTYLEKSRYIEHSDSASARDNEARMGILCIRSLETVTNVDVSVLAYTRTLVQHPQAGR